MLHLVPPACLQVQMNNQASNLLTANLRYLRQTNTERRALVHQSMGLPGHPSSAVCYTSGTGDIWHRRRVLSL
jgi:hypothetical protein